MTRFYDPKDEKDLARVESLLHKGGIEYSLKTASNATKFAIEIDVAEEDVPKAEEILLKDRPGR